MASVKVITRTLFTTKRARTTLPFQKKTRKVAAINPFKARSDLVTLFCVFETNPQPNRIAGIPIVKVMKAI